MAFCVYVVWYVFLFFFKQKTAYEMRISDWSSDVCSSDLGWPFGGPGVSIEHAAARLRYERVKLEPNSSVAKVPSIGAGEKLIAVRSEERRVGKECVSTCRYRWSQSH